MTRIASCQCRGFRIIVEAEQPDTVAICHCQICQRPRLSGETQTAQLLLPDLSICVQISLVLLLGASTTEISPLLSRQSGRRRCTHGRRCPQTFSIFSALDQFRVQAKLVASFTVQDFDPAACARAAIGIGSRFAAVSAPGR